MGGLPSHCASCGATLPPDAAFCGNCGQRVGVPVSPAALPVLDPALLFTPLAPAASADTVTHGSTPPPPWWRRPAVALAVLAVLVIALGVVVLATRGGDEPSTTSDTGSTTSQPASTTSTTLPATTTTAAPTTTVAADPAARLQQLTADDRAIALTLVGKHVVQLSAKRVGLVVDDVTYGPTEIYDDHVTLRTLYDAILVDATTFQFAAGGKPMTGWYLTIVPTPFTTKAAADAWCTDEGLPPSDCFSRVFMPPV